MTQNEANLQALRALGGIQGIAEITSWINERYGDQWKSCSTAMADMMEMFLHYSPYISNYMVFIYIFKKRSVSYVSTS